MTTKVSRLFLILLPSIWLLAGPEPTLAAKRIALVIGNGAYSSISPLDNPPADARLMARTLKETGFEVASHIDVDSVTMSRAILKFGRDLRAAGSDAVGLFYYAGHGVQASGTNYLIPIGTEIQDEAELTVLAVDMSWVLAQMEAAGNDINMIVLDACRNNPFKSRFRSASRGLARINAPRGSFISYATGPGEVAEDGVGANSPFTKALAEHMKTPGLAIETVFKKVRSSVLDATGKRQTPWETSSLTGDFYFVPAKATAKQPTGLSGQGQEATLAALPETPSAQDSPSEHRSIDNAQTERLFYETASNISSPEAKSRALEAYLEKYPDGQFASLAEIQLASLKQPEPTEPTAPQATETDETAAEQQVAAVPEEPLPEKVKPSPEAIEAALSFNRSERMLIQESLTAMGHNTGGIDGALGRKSRRAITAWQLESGFEPSGFLTSKQHGLLLAEAKPAVEARRAEKRKAAAAAITTNAGQASSKQTGKPRVARKDATVSVMNLTALSLSRSANEQIINTARNGLSPHWPSVTNVQLQVTNWSVRDQVANENLVGAAIIGGLLGGGLGGGLGSGMGAGLGAGLAAQSANRVPTTKVHSASVTVIVSTKDGNTVTESATVERQDPGHQQGLPVLLLQQAAQDAISRASTRLAGGTPSGALSHSTTTSGGQSGSGFKQQNRR